MGSTTNPQQGSAAHSEVSRPVAPKLSSPATPLRPYPTPLRWAVFGVVGAAIVISAWLFAIRASTNPVGNGLLVPPQGLSSIIAPADGLVTELLVAEGEYVDSGTQVGTLSTPSGELLPIVSEFSGEIVGGWEYLGAAVTLGEPVAQIVATEPLIADTSTAGRRAALVTELVVFVPVSQIKAIDDGTPGTLEFRDFPAAQYGAVEYQTMEVYRLPLAQSELSSFYGGSGGLVQTTDGADEALKPIRIKLATDPTTPSGYAWTFGQGPPTEIPLASQVTATFTTAERPLIETPGASQ